MPINLINMEGTRPPTGASPTQPYKCSQNVKIKTVLTLALAFAEINKFAEINTLTLIL